MKHAEKIMSELIHRITIEEEFGWPPECWGPFYQPERPVPCNESHDTPNEQASAADE